MDLDALAPVRRNLIGLTFVGGGMRGRYLDIDVIAQPGRDKGAG